MSGRIPVNSVAFLALVLTTLALIPSGAHLFALPNKIALAQEPYFIVQSIYRGWALFGFVLIPAMFVNAWLAHLRWNDGAAAYLIAAAALLLAATLVVFFLWIYPGNQATSNWTVVPANWQDLRFSWEYGHAVNAVLTFIALMSLYAAMFVRR